MERKPKQKRWLTKTNLLVGCMLIAATIVSCNKSKDYIYVAVVEKENIMGGVEIKDEESETIKATSDSVAYLEAYEKFCISLKVSRDMKESIGRASSTPIKFVLLNEQKKDISSTVSFASKKESEIEIAQRIFSLENRIKVPAGKD